MDHATLYSLTKALHLISVIAWMAALFYLPRLFVYHVSAAKGSDKSETFKIMERRLLKIIANPAMILSWFFALILIFYFKSIDFSTDIWFHVKLLLVIAMSALHMMLARYVKVFARDENRRSARFYRIINEVPTVLMILIVLLVIVRPF